MDKKERIHSLDVLKFIFAIMVCYIHTQDVASSYALAIARIAVPGFFMITGFFYQQSYDKGRIKAQIVKLLQIFIVGYIIYFIQYLAAKIANGTVLEFLKEQFSFANLFDLIILCRPTVGGHLWYIVALIFGLLVFTFFKKINKLKYIYIAIPVQLTLLMILGKYSVFVFGTDISTMYTKNWFFVGLPFIALGYLANKYSYEIKLKISYIFNIIFVLLFSITTCVERYILIRFNVEGTRDFYISTIFLTVFIIILFVRMPNFGKNTFMEKIGHKYSLVIYVSHILVIKIFEVGMGVLNLTHIWNNLKPVQFIIVFISALIIAIICDYITNKYKKGNKYK